MEKSLKACALAAILVFGVASLCAPRAAAQDGSISGTVLDLDGKPWADCGVNLEADQGTKQSTKTDKAGKYSFTGLKAGTYKLSVMLPLQKDPFTAQVKVTGGQNVPADLNFLELIAKKNPEYVAAVKKQGEEKSKFGAMKQHFDQGVAR